jgi:alkanesulfonate monooxygenase
MSSNGVNGTNDKAGLLVNGGLYNDLEYAEKLNADPDRIKFAYWVPNVSGGLVISKIPQNTHWDLESNVKYARTAEKVGMRPHWQ